MVRTYGGLWISYIEQALRKQKKCWRTQQRWIVVFAEKALAREPKTLEKEIGKEGETIPIRGRSQRRNRR